MIAEACNVKAVQTASVDETCTSRAGFEKLVGMKFCGLECGQDFGANRRQLSGAGRSGNGRKTVCLKASGPPQETHERSSTPSQGWTTPWRVSYVQTCSPLGERLALTAESCPVPGFRLKTRWAGVGDPRS